MKFGCQLPQETDDFNHLIEVASECESLGYDSVWAYDHLSPFWSRSGQILECWTVLSAVAESTRKIKVGSLVTNVALRNPSLLAKMSSTLDDISNGRLILGLGTGDKMSRNELLSYGYKFASLDERVERLKETILILKAMWTKEEASFQGKYYKISHAINFPKPRQTPHPPIWVGGKHPKILDVVAEMADGWDYWELAREELLLRSEYLRKKCAENGRRPEDIIKSWSGTFSHLFRRSIEGRGLVEGIMKGLQSQVDAETKYFIVYFGPKADRRSYQAFAEAVTSLG